MFMQGEIGLRLERVSKEERRKLMGHKSFLVWFTGLSGSGKSTLATALERELFSRGFHTFVLDGDVIRKGLNKDLGFSAEDRTENIRRVGEVAKLMVDAGLVTIAAFISPFRRIRQMVRGLMEPGEFIEVYLDCPLEVCEMRDPKGLYAKARQGLIKEFTGIDSPYEPPENPELVLNTAQESVQESLNKLMRYLEENGYLVRF